MGLLEVGSIARSHGLSGEVIVYLVTNRLERVAPGSRLVAAAGAGPGSGRTLEVVAARPFGTRHLVWFAGVDSRDAADSLHGWTLYAEPVTDAEELFVHDLVGKLVVDNGGIERGRVVAVEANPASDLLVTDSGALVPARFIVSADATSVHVEAPEGLFE